MPNLSALDINLLLAFEALLLEGSVTKAADRAGMAQPTMSNALSRLRYLFDDELFVRTPKGMQPTARARELAGPISDLLARMRKLLHRAGPFDPMTTEHCFVIGIAPFANHTMLPSFVRMFRREAPNANVHYYSLEQHDEAELLDEALIDLAIGIVVDLPKRFGVCTLFWDRPVCISRKAHPALRHGMALDRFVEIPHAHATHYMETVVDLALTQQGLARRVAMIGHSYWGLGVMVANSDLLAIVPERVASELARFGHIDAHEIPLALEAQPIGVAWSKHGESDPAVNWLRQRICDLFGGPGLVADA